MIGKTDKITSPFSIAEARSLVKDLFPPNLAIYWTDFLGTYFLGIFCFQRVRGGPLWVPHQGWTGQWSQVAWFLASCLLFYRAAMFIHELVHQRNDHMSQFRHAWNLLCGIPFLMPLFVYYPHIDHHRRSHYGTHHDGEYLPLAHFRVFFLVFYLSWSFIIPILAVFRFLILTPVAWVFPAVRTWVHARCSTMVMDPSYIRPLPSPRVLQEIRWQEACCFAWCWGVAVVPPLVLGHSSLPFVIHAYLTGVVIVLLNSIRTLGAHRWSNQGGEMTYVEQLLDSVNYPRHVWLSEFWGPVGTRFHALHHLFPSLPYHALSEAHRRLMQGLPSDSPYHRTEEVSLAVGLAKLVFQRPAEATPTRRLPKFLAADAPKSRRRVRQNGTERRSIQWRSDSTAS